MGIVGEKVGDRVATGLVGAFVATVYETNKKPNIAEMRILPSLLPSTIEKKSGFNFLLVRPKV
jgi:hypothetical protein